jgi:lipopolysaccharide export system ATP-binding protein
MKIFPFLHNKLKKPDQPRPERLTPEEEQELEGNVPDMRTLEIKEQEIVAGPDGDTVITEKVDVPEKGVLRTDNLVKKYGKRTVANHVSIEVTQGEIVGLLGPNGAGKTTTFYMTVGLITPNEGRVFLNDVDITEYPVYKRAQIGIGYLPQEASVFRTLSVENNIKAILEMTHTSKEYQKAKLEQLISEFNLNHVRHNLGTSLSGGERRRTEIARCLAINPKFIMLDEPFAAVDPIAVEDIQEVVYHLKERNIGVLITDHKADSILGITDRAYMLFEGRVLFQGTSAELASNPVVREKYLGRDFIFTPKKFEPKRTKQ